MRERMRERKSKLLALAFMIAPSLVFTACTPSDSSGELSALDTSPSDSESRTAITMESDITPLERLLANPSMQSHNEQISIENADIEIYAEDGNIYVLRFTLKEQIDLTPQESFSVFDEAVGRQADVYQSARDNAANELGMEDLVIRVICINADGTQLYSKDFK